MLEASVKLNHFCAKRFGFNRSRVARFNRIDYRYWKWLLLLETGQAHTLETLQDQIRRAIAASDTCPNQSCAGAMEKILGSMPIRAARLDQRNAKHAMLLERVLEHLAIPRLENVKRQQRMRKQHRTGKRHHWQLLG